MFSLEVEKKVDSKILEIDLDALHSRAPKSTIGKVNIFSVFTGKKKIDIVHLIEVMGGWPKDYLLRSHILLSI